LLCLSAVVPAHATLFTRLDGTAAYDDALGITWTTDANLSGARTWSGQVAWADNFSLGGFDDWRLASLGELESMYAQIPGDRDRRGSPTVGGTVLTNVLSVYWSATQSGSGDP